jgi:hypothetical protein
MNTRYDRACRCDEITNLTMGDIEDLGFAVLKDQNTNNYKSRSFTILRKFYFNVTAGKK